MISEKTLKNLEFDKILNIIANYVSSSVARQKIFKLRPSSTFDEANLALQMTVEADRMVYEFLVNPNFSFDEIFETLMSAKKYAILSQSELLKVGRLLKTARKVRLDIDSVECEELFLLKEIASGIFENYTLETHINEWLLNETEIADYASDKLFNLRREIRKANDSIKKKMQDYVQSNRYQQYLQDAIITIRSDRYVIPVKAEYKNSIPGLVHDQSTSGATVFIEPFPIVELNNELKTLLIEEKNEIERILAELSESVGSCAERLVENCNIISELDIVFAKAIYAHNIKATKPILNNRSRINIKEGRHPLIEKSTVVPVSVSVGENYSILLVTGPNTGGKTVTLKLTGLLTVMALSGMFIPALEESEVGVFESIFTDIGDEQSIQQNLSTFSAHIKNIGEILAKINENSLVLLDELGAGTDPAEGAAIAVAVTEEILNRRTKAIITSHFSEMKAFSFSTEGIENASMEFNPETYEPTYKLNIGIPGASNALKIAERLGLSASIIERARNYISEDRINFESVLLDAESVRLNAVAKLEEIESARKEISNELAFVEREKKKLNEKRQRFIEQAEKEAKKIIDDYIEEAEEIIEKLKNAKNRNDDKGYFEATKLNKAIHRLKYKTIEESVDYKYDDSAINEGDYVFVDALNAEAKVIKIKPNGKCVLKVGNIEMNSLLSDVKKIKKSTVEDLSEKSRVTIAKPLNTEMVKTEINVIGQDREECLYNVGYFLDKSVVAGVNCIKIIHGTGSGVLRRAISDFLKKHPAVKSFRAGRFGEGDNGVTIVELK